MPAKRRTPPKTGLLDSVLVGNLKKPGMPPELAVTQTLREAPPDELKAAFAKASVQERHAAFDVIPADQIKPMLGTMRQLLEPGVPLPAAPSPTGGPPSTILQTTYENEPYPPAQTDPDWAQKLTGGETVGVGSGSPLQWMPVYNPAREREGSLDNPMVGLTGWVITSQPLISSTDVWFTHPFGNDFEFFIAPDPQYDGLLGAHNTGTDTAGNVTEPEYEEGTKHARGLGLSVPKGVIGVETDQGLVPPAFQNLFADKARIAAFGRWIVDCGHSDFHTEIHPPLLLAVARAVPPPIGLPGASQMTRVDFVSRPYTVGQLWDDGNFAQHLLHEVGKVETTFMGVPRSLRVEAHPAIYTQPYEGRPVVILHVQPPVPRNHPDEAPQTLMVSFHFTHRTNVAIEVYEAGNETVGIIIVFGDLNPATLPPKHDRTISWDEVGTDYLFLIEGLSIENLLNQNVASAFILNRGILTDIYDAPDAQSPLDNQNVAGQIPAGQLQPGIGLSEDDAQPFPLYGWMNVYWQQPQVVVQGPPISIG